MGGAADFSLHFRDAKKCLALSFLHWESRSTEVSDAPEWTQCEFDSGRRRWKIGPPKAFSKGLLKPAPSL